MLIARLFVEGALEVQILNPILQGSPVVQQGGSKYSLKPRARTERQANIEDHRQRMAATTDAASVQASLDAFAARFDDAFVADVANVLLWFSGKDLLAGIADWLITKGVANPGAFLASLRDWVIANPVRAIELLPEWNSMVEVVRA
jgi:hypothetical protein